MTLFRFLTSVLVAGLVGASPMSRAAVDNVIYINGINTTLGEMLIDRNNARSALNPENSSNVRIFSVSYVHNPVGWFNIKDDAAASQDRKELFLLKTAEECFAADFERIIVPHNQSRAVDRSAAARVSTYLYNIVPGRKGGHSCGANSLSDPDDGVTAAEMSATRTAAFRLSERIRSYNRVIVVAHSQGNLLANLAYAHVVSLVGDEASKLVRIVNIANNARFRASALEMSHANDLALAGLELLGQSYTRTTPRCANERCNFRLAGATLEGVSVAGDTYNHGFVKTYLSNYPVGVSDAQGVTFTSNTRSFRERFVDFVYAASLSLDMVNGSPLTVIARGAVAYIDSGNALIGEALPIGFSVGSPITLEMSISATAEDKFPQDSNWDRYLGRDLTAVVGANAPITGTHPEGLTVFDVYRQSYSAGYPGAALQLSGQNGACQGCIQKQIVLYLLNGPNGYFTSDTLRTRTIDVNVFQNRYIWIAIFADGRVTGNIYATVDSLVLK